MSIFNVHINRMPCAAEISSIQYTRGKFLNAMKAESAEENESNTLILNPDEPWAGPIVVRQIVGLIARTIVCRVEQGQHLSSGAQFGMIKFGSGTEMIVPRRPGQRVLVTEGQKVAAGLTEFFRID